MGKSSFAMELVFSHHQQVFARGTVVMVCVKLGKSVEIPVEMRSLMLLPNGNPPPALSPTTKSTQPSWEGTVNMQVTMRSSDEDTNKHVKHVRYCHFVEDCVQEVASSAAVEAITVTYSKECRRGEVCSLVLHHNKQEAWFEMWNEQSQKVCEAMVQFRLNNKTF